MTLTSRLAASRRRISALQKKLAQAVSERDKLAEAIKAAEAEAAAKTAQAEAAARAAESQHE